MRLQNKIAIITGAASGIGKAAAKAFIDEGASVCLVDIQGDLGNQVCRELADASGDVIFIKADVSKASEVQNSVIKTLEKWGRIDILVNNAAVPIRKNIVDLTEQEWDLMLDVNLKSVYLYSHLVVPKMVEQGGGVIINMSSVAGLVACPQLPGYVASKTGIIGLTRNLALDYGPYRIRANCICPSNIDTPQMDWFFKQSPNPELAKKENNDLHPLGRMAAPSEVAALVVFLASDDAIHITGSAYAIDAGYSIR